MKNSIKISLYFGVLFSFTGGLNTFAQEVITLQQAIENTLKSNLQIKQAEISAAITDENLTQSKFALYPTLNGNSNVNKNFGRSIDPSTNEFISQQFTGASGNLSAGIDLFQGFQKINQIRQNRLLLAVDKTNVDKVKNDLILDVVTSYMQILFNTDLVTVSTQQLTVAKQTFNRQQALLDVGNKTLADISQAKSQVATSELDVTNAKNNLAISFLNLNQLMEMPSEYRYQVQAPVIDAQTTFDAKYNIPEIYSNALRTFPDIKLAALRTEAAAKSIAIAKGSYYPRLSLNAGLGSNYSSGRKELISSTPDGTREIGRTSITNEAVLVPNFSTLFANQTFNDQIQDNFNQSVGLNLSIPIFNGFAARSNVRRAKLNYQNVQVQEQLAKNNLSKVISQAVADVRAAESRFRSTANAFAAQKDAFYAIDQRYGVGLVNSVEYSTALTNRNRAEIDSIQAKYDLIFKTKVIDYYLGKQIAFQ